MSQIYERPLSNLSYTNKDFGAIYPELLDLAKTISYKWDPTISNESDPGVVLLKLMAIIADKNNYNIDKNILELFPESVTQTQNAREIFEQCGYTMRHYVAAETAVSLTLVKEPTLSQTDLVELKLESSADLDDPLNERTYSIPQFTMLSDVDNKLIFTLVQDVKLRSTGVTQVCTALQGTIHDYTVNGGTKITRANLDHDNRLYFSEMDVAQNGIFISNDIYSYSDWVPVDNLGIQPLNTPCYKFGISYDGTRCYIEFPSDIDSLMAEGLTIKYIRTRGAEGNTGRKEIAQFYGDISAKKYLTRRPDYSLTPITLTTENVFITNQLPAHGGLDPETIKEAKLNYNKVKTTFDTLVSLNDYTNYIYSSNMVSNGFVCDRSNDVQSVVKIRETNNTTDRIITRVITEGKDALIKPHEIKLYGFEFVESVTSSESFNRTFNVLSEFSVNETHIRDRWEEFDSIKCLLHDVREYEKNKIIMLKNVYPLNIKLIPTHNIEVGSQEETEIIERTRSALYEVLNSRRLKFGSPLNYDVVYDAIVNCDERIRALTIDDIEYETYAVYLKDLNNIQSIRVDSNYQINNLSDDEKTLISNFRKEILARAILCGVTPLYEQDTRFKLTLDQTSPNIIPDVEMASGKTTLLLEYDGNTGAYKSAELLSNENLVLTAPNLIGVAEYGVYVRYVYDGPNLLSKADKKLTGDNYIVFFWKEDDDEGTPYSYVKYTATSNIYISPSFALKKTVIEEQISSLIEDLPEGSGTLSGSNSGLNDIVSKMNDSSIQAGKKITIKKLNTVTIDKNVSPICWITNNTDSEDRSKSILFNEGESTYTLTSGEYVFYTNNSRTQFNVLGSGTTVSRLTSDGNTITDSKWSIRKPDYSTLVSHGLDYIEEEKLWFTLPTDTKLQVLENEFVQLGPKSTLYLSTVDGNMIKDTVNNGGTYDSVDIQYLVIDGTEGIKSALFDSDSNAWVLDTTPLEDTTAFTLSYTTSENSAREFLAVKSDDEAAWKCNMYLMLNTTSNSVIELVNDSTSYKQQSLTLTSKASVSIGGGTNSFYVQTSLPVNAVLQGSKNITYTDTYTGALHNIDFLYYGKVEDEDKDYTLNEDSKLIIELTATESSANLTVPFKSIVSELTTSIVTDEESKCNFIIPVYISRPLNDEETIEFMVGETTIKVGGEIPEDETVDNSPKSQYQYIYCEITKDADTDKTITITSTDLAEPVEIIISPAIPYSYAHTLVDEGHVKTQIMMYDADNRFNYTYYPEETMKIEDPLNSNSFFDADHPYNAFTIPQWVNVDTKRNRINITRVSSRG